MTVTTAFKDQVGSVTDTNLDLYKLDPTKWLLVSDEAVGKGTRCLYVFNAGNTAFNTYLEITSGPRTVKGKPRNFAQVKILETLLSTDDVTTVVTELDQMETWVGISTPAHVAVTPAIVANWILATISAWFPTITAGAVDTGLLEKALRGHSKLY